jgi:uncharacterized Ntn-hydrolase superfamily protein
LASFSLIGLCGRTGQFGAVVASAGIAEAGRVGVCQPGVGAALSQHRTDPRLSRRAIALLQDGCSADETADAIQASSEHREWRQIAVLDATGRTAARTGKIVRAALSEVPADGMCAIGCGLVRTRVIASMAHSFQANTEIPLGERLMRTLEAGEEAGGLDPAARSAALLVVDRLPFPLIDLRIDWHDRPVHALRELWERFAPLSGDYAAGALDPRHARVL